MTGCHQPSERFTGTIVPFAWFAQGLRMVDIADPFRPQEVGYFVPGRPAPAPSGLRQTTSPSTSRGLLYLVDRVNGVDIVEADAFW